jgi:hypothetical protein
VGNPAGPRARVRDLHLGALRYVAEQIEQDFADPVGDARCGRIGRAHRSSGLIWLDRRRKLPVKFAIDGRFFTFALGGYLPVKASPFQLRAGRTGRGVNPPPQFGQTFSSTPATQAAQNVHSKLQIIASVDSGGSARCSARRLAAVQASLHTSDRFLHCVPIVIRFQGFPDMRRPHRCNVNRIECPVALDALQRLPIGSASRGRTRRATSLPSFMKISVGHSLTLNERPSRCPLPSSIFR